MLIAKFIGYISYKLYCARIKYMNEVNNQSVDNSKNSSISGNCILVHHENIFLGENSYINGGYLLASENSKIVI